MQNQLIECAGKVISNKLVEEIKESGVFAILADESTDFSNKEQLALIIRFIDRNNEIREEFLKFIYMDSGVRGEELKSKILETLREQVLICRIVGDRVTMVRPICPVSVVDVHH